jgi:putative transposase
VDAGTGEVWWPQISKEAFGDGIRAAVDAYWNWQSSRAGTRRGRARILAATVSRRGTGLVAAFRVLVQRPIQPRVIMPGSRVGVDVGVRVLATVASSGGEVIERVPNPRPLETALRQLRHLSRERSRRTRGSRRYRQAQRKITQLQRRVANIGSHHIHALTTRLVVADR